MPDPAELRIDLETSSEALLRDLGRGGAFITGAQAPLYSECPLVLVAGARELRVLTRVVWSDGNGIGIEILEFGAALRDAVADLVPDRKETIESSRPMILLPNGDPAEPSEFGTADAEGTGPVASVEGREAGEAGGPGEAAEASDRPATLHERLRNLPMHEQIKLALTGDSQERMILERMYGKTVWEALLRNPRLTPPEVARIARMGSLPKPLIETVVGNGGWIAVPEVRRALLSNPRLTPDQSTRILRVMPKSELKLVPTQSNYPVGVRDAARRLLRGDG